jgi:hypothetical protein
MDAMTAFALFAAATGVSPSGDGEQFAQLTIQQRVVIRVPVVPIAAEQVRPLRWVEKKGPKCIASNSLAGAIVTAPRAIDLVTRGGPRLRAQLDGSCQAVDLRFGFYIRPNSDGKICADRDAIHARTGGQCEIEKFRTLIPER